MSFISTLAKCQSAVQNGESIQYRGVRLDNGQWEIWSGHEPDFQRNNDKLEATSDIGPHTSHLVISVSHTPGLGLLCNKMSVDPEDPDLDPEVDPEDVVSEDVRSLHAIPLDPFCVYLASHATEEITSNPRGDDSLALLIGSDKWIDEAIGLAVSAWRKGFGLVDDGDATDSIAYSLKYGKENLRDALERVGHILSEDDSGHDVLLRFGSAVLKFANNQEAAHAGWQIEGVSGVVAPYSADDIQSVFELKSEAALRGKKGAVYWSANFANSSRTSETIQSERTADTYAAETELADQLDIQFNLFRDQSAEKCDHWMYTDSYALTAPTEDEDTRNKKFRRASVSLHDVPLGIDRSSEALKHSLEAHKGLWTKAYHDRSKYKSLFLNRGKKANCMAVLDQVTQAGLSQLMERINSLRQANKWSEDDMQSLSIRIGGFCFLNNNGPSGLVHPAYKVFLGQSEVATSVDGSIAPIVGKLPKTQQWKSKVKAEGASTLVPSRGDK